MIITISLIKFSLQGFDETAVTFGCLYLADVLLVEKVSFSVNSGIVLRR